MNAKKIHSLFVPVFKRDGVPFISGKGSYLYDSNGKSYLDFGTGIAVNALGHGHPALQNALVKQGKSLIHLSNLYFSKPQADLAAMLVKNSFGKKVFFCNSGTEANEAAIKFSRKWAEQQSPDKYNILSFTDGFHGRTYGALTATAQEKFHTGFKPLVGGFHYAPFNDNASVKKLFSRYDFAAVMVEPLQGEGGVNSATKDFLVFLRELCTTHKCALIFDEIQCGMGRTGTLWNYQHYKVVPDMMTLAKPLGGGLPLGAVITNEAIAQSMKYGDHGTTFGGNPVACALGVALLQIVSDKCFLKEVQEKGAYLYSRLNELKSSFPSIETVLGKGLLLGIRMKTDPADKDPADIVSLCRDAGLLVIKAGHNTIRFLPPLNVKKNDIDKAIKLFTNVLKSIKR